MRRLPAGPFALCFALGFGAGWAGETLRPLDQLGLEEAKPTIEWKETWQGTYDANKKRWTEELRAATKDGRIRDLSLSLRLIALLEELGQRFPADTARRIAAYGEIAERFAEAGCRGRANHYLKRIVDEFPGEREAATAALQKILSGTAEQVRQVEDGEAWVDYALDRLMAMNRAGHLPDAHLLIELAWKTRLRQAKEDGSFWDAAQALEKLQAILGPTPWWRMEEAELLLAAGRRDEAMLRLDELAAEGGNGRAASLLQELSRERVSEGPEFPRRWALEARWDTARGVGRVPELSMVHGLLPEAAKSDGLFPFPKSATQGSLWATMERELLALPPAELAPLRAMQQREAASRLRVPSSSRQSAARNAEALFGHWRRCPWAPQVHDALMAFAEDALRRGQVGLAYRAFHDVVRYSADSPLKAKAKMGIELALRASRSRAPESAIGRPQLAIVALPAPPGFAFRVSGSEFQSTIRNRQSAIGWPEPSAQVVAGEGSGRLFVAGPNLLACFGEDLRAPVWWRAPELSRGEEAGARRWMTVPGPFVPVAVGDRVFTRWGLDASGQFPTGVAAFEAATGQPVWSTHGRAWCEGLCPISDPAVADGRLYFLAVRGTSTALAPVWLVCLDASDGALLWQKFLASCSLGLARAAGSPHIPAEQLDLVHYGNAPLLHLGAVYCSTNLGFVARCDARDGLVEWVRTYPRLRAGKNLGDVVKRQGATPVATGGSVVFAPRDYSGAFALDAATGAALWGAPFAPSHQVLGEATGKMPVPPTRQVGGAGGTGVPPVEPSGKEPVAGAILLRDDERLVALDLATGRPRWERRFDEAIEGALLAPGGEALVRTERSLWRIAAATGETIERSAWAATDAGPGLAPRGGGLVAVSERLAPPAPVPRAAPQSALAFPLRRAWTLQRPDPALWAPPSGSPLEGRVYLLSQGVLECVSKGAEGMVQWRRAARGGVKGVNWNATSMLLIYPRRILALDGTSGERRWEAEVPFDIQEWRPCGDGLLVFRPRQGREAAMVRLATGEVVWSRTFGELFGRASFTLDAAAWDGRQLHFFTGRLSARREGPAELFVRPSDGLIVGTRPFPREGDGWPLQIASDDKSAFLIGKDSSLYEYSLADGSLRSLGLEMKHLDPRRIQRFFADDTWVHLYWDRGYDAEPDKHWLVRRGGPPGAPAIIRRKAWGEKVGDRLFEPTDGAGILTAFDPRTGAAIVYRLPPGPPGESAGSIIRYHEAGERVFVVSTVQANRGQALRVDSFNRADGQPLESWRPPELEARANEVAWAPGAMLVTDPSGLHCFAAAPPTEGRPRPVHVAYRLPKPLPPGGLLLESGGRDVVRLSDTRDARGSLYVAHDEESLHVAVRYRDPEATPWSGEAAVAAGDWLELGLKTNLGVYRLGLGLDAGGKLQVRGLGGTALPSGLRATLQHDAAERLYSCELHLPWKAVLKPAEDWRRIGLWAVAWDDRPATGGSAAIFAWGRDRPGEQAGASIPDTLYLDARTREQGDAMAAVVEGLPDLPVSLDLFKRDAAMRSASRDELFERYWGFIERRPQGPSAEALLLEMGLAEASERPQGGLALPARAAQAGVPEAVRQRVLWQLGAHLSQWVYLNSPKDLRSLLIEMNSGTGADEWGHRAYWGKPIANWIIPPREMGAMAELPMGKWHELRIPLFLIEMHDKPICGINFCQQGTSRIFWDRSAVVAGGKATVFIEDDTPKGAVRGVWDWVDDPHYSGAKAHTHTPPAAHYEVRSHTAMELDEPVVAHLAAPLDRPWLSQWVYLDPRDPPAAVAIGLHDGRGWAFRAVWGKRALRGRPMGPLPPAGQWHELRLPLAWTPFLPRSIAGLAFCHVGGRVVWDRTALVVAGKEQVLLDDETPALRPEKGTFYFSGAEKLNVPFSGGWRSWVDGFDGGVTPAPGKVGVGMRCDGYTGCVRVPHSPELDPSQFTAETWVYLDTFALGGDTKQWLVNKNGHAWEDGYFGLTIYRDKVGADINIGGGKDGRFEVWSEEGALKLRRWYHLAMTYDGASLRLYLDGQQAAETAVNKERAPGRGTLYLARWAFGRQFFAGILDEVRLYRRALSLAEIQVRHADPAALSPQVAEAVVGYWGFDAEAAPPDPTADWQFVDQPVKFGKKAHTSRSDKGVGGHSLAILKEPIVAHLPFDRPQAVSVLQAQIPRLGPTDETWQLFGDLLQLELPNPQRRIELGRWFLAAFPGHPKAIDVLAGLLDACIEAGDPDPTDRVLELTKEFALPASVLYHYHRRHARTPREFVRGWQLIGPFPGQGEGWGIDAPYPPEADGVMPDRAYPGLRQEVRWRAATSEGSYVNLKALIGPAENAVAYAAAWVHSDRERPAVLAVGSDDRCKVWLGGKLVLAGQNATFASAGEFIAPVTLAQGWNEVLLKVSQGTGEWGFYFELLDQSARKPPLGVRIATTPPEAK